jgi:hypothetical protein
MKNNLRVCRMCGKLFDEKMVAKHEAECSERPGTIIVNNKPPKEYNKKIAEGVNVKALYLYEKKVLDFIKGEEHSIFLEREPDNEFDSNAIKVIAKWIEGNTEKSEIVGYVPREISAKVAKHSGEAIIGCLQYIRLPKKQTQNRPRVEPQLFYDIYLAKY